MRNRISQLMAGSSPFAMAVFEGEGAGVGAGDPPVAAPETVLFPNENGENKDGDPAAGDKPTDPPAGDPPAAEWKEYVNDPAKSEAENAAAKAEHDKTKPADNKNDDAANKVPEDGKYALTMPDGVEVDQELLDALGPKFAAKKLTQAEAQELADEFIKVQQARAGKQMETWGETIAKWADDAKSDKEIGGTNWDGTVAASRRAVEQLGTPALKEYLNASGGGNHPELIRFMAKVGSMIKEDSPANGGAEGAGKPAEPAHVLFPNDAPKGT